MNLRTKYEVFQDQQCRETIHFLKKNEIFFNLICEIKNVSFDPPLPKEILESFQNCSLFALAGYTFDSLTLLQNGIMFEAGFGSDNIGSYVQIDYKHILQIAVTSLKDHNVPLFIRLNSSEIFDEGKENKETSEIERSMEAILSHPHNQKFFPDHK